MPRPARLDPYRDIIVQLHTEGYTPPEIRQHLENNQGVTVPDSTWFDYLKRCQITQPNDGLALSAAAPRLSPLPTPPEPDAALTALVHATTEELVDRFAQVIATVQQLKTDQDARTDTLAEALQTFDPQGIRETIARHTQAFDAMLLRLEATVRWRARLRMGFSMALLTGALWGVGLICTSLWGYGPW